MKVRQFVLLSEELIFGLTETVVGEQFILDDVLVRTNERQRRPDVIFAVIDSRDDWSSSDELLVGELFVRPFQVFQDSLLAPDQFLCFSEFMFLMSWCTKSTCGSTFSKFS